MDEKKINEKELNRVSGGFTQGKNYVFCAGDRFIDGNCGRIYFIEENITISDLGKLLTCIIIDNKNVFATYMIFEKDKKKKGGKLIKKIGRVKKLDIDNRRVILNNDIIVLIDNIKSIII